MAFLLEQHIKISANSLKLTLRTCELSYPKNDLLGRLPKHQFFRVQFDALQGGQTLIHLVESSQPSCPRRGNLVRPILLTSSYLTVALQMWSWMAGTSLTHTKITWLTHICHLHTKYVTCTHTHTYSWHLQYIIYPQHCLDRVFWGFRFWTWGL